MASPNIDGMNTTSLSTVSRFGTVKFTQWAISSDSLSLNIYARDDIPLFSGNARPYSVVYVFPDGTTETETNKYYTSSDAGRKKLVTTLRLYPGLKGVVSDQLNEIRIYAYDSVNDFYLFDVNIVVGVNSMLTEIETVTEEIFVGEYDYTEYFEELVNNSTVQNQTLTNIKNKLADTFSEVRETHILAFVCCLLGLGVLVRKILKGVIL